MTCIKTGAYVHFVEYGAYAPADLFDVGGCIVIQWTREGWTYEPHRTPSHRVTIGQSGYHHDHRGVTVVRAENCEAES